MQDDKEQRRKDAQRQIRELVLRLRKEGKSEADVEKAKKELKHKIIGGHGGRSAAGKRFRESFGNGQGTGYGKSADARYRGNSGARAWKDRNGSKDYGGRKRFEDREEDPEKAMKRDELAKKHDVVVIPIVWRRKEQEAEMVMTAAQALKDKLAAHRINTWIDRRHSLSPGQKYAYWESMGVKFRLEMGPAEATQGTVCLSKAVSGELAQRWKDLDIKNVRGLHELLKVLHEEGLKWLKWDTQPCLGCESIQQRDEKFPSEPMGPAEKKVRTHVEFPDSDDSEDEHQSQQDKKKAPEKSSGDGLEVNYVLD